MENNFAQKKLSSWAMWWQMKLVNGHEDGQSNPIMEVALDFKKT